MINKEEQGRQEATNNNASTHGDLDTSVVEDEGGEAHDEVLLLGLREILERHPESV